LLHLIFGLNVRGRENLPERGPFVLAANHNSHLDILVICAALPVRLLSETHVVAARDYFSRFPLVFAVVDFLFSPVWVDRGAESGNAFQRMGAILDAGKSIVIFPEGTRGDTDRLGPFRSGVGRLVSERPAVPLLPIFLRGPERAMPRKSPVPLPIWQHVTIGPPLRLAGNGDTNTEALRECLAALERSERGARHKRRSERKAAVVVAVLGIDGSGKSTLSRRLAMEYSSRLSCSLIGDRFELFAGGGPQAAQPFLKEKIRRWMSAQSKDAKSLARYRVPKLAELLLRDALLGEAQRWYGNDLIVMDGSPLLNMTAWSVLYRPEMMSVDFCSRAMKILAGRHIGEDALFSEFQELRAMKRLGLTRLGIPDVVLFLDVDPAVSMERINRRGEKVQVHETIEKLGQLREAYMVVMEAVRTRLDLPAITLGGEGDIESIAVEARRLIDGVLEGRWPPERRAE